MAAPSAHNSGVDDLFSVRRSGATMLRTGSRTFCVGEFVASFETLPFSSGDYTLNHADIRFLGRVVRRPRVSVVLEVFTDFV